MRVQTDQDLTEPKMEVLLRLRVMTQIFLCVTGRVINQKRKVDQLVCFR